MTQVIVRGQIRCLTVMATLQPLMMKLAMTGPPRYALPLSNFPPHAGERANESLREFR